MNREVLERVNVWKERVRLVFLKKKVARSRGAGQGKC